MSIRLDKRICPFSGEEFIPKRRNQIYAKSGYRIAHNNEVGRAKREKTSKLNKILFKNAEILKGILKGANTKKVHREFLRGAGFSFDGFTGLVEDKASNTIFYGVYGFGFKKIDNEYFKIIKND